MNKETTFVRFKQAVGYLKDRGKIHKQQDIADVLGIGKSNFSRIYNGHDRYFTESFLHRFADAYSDYINKDWLLNGEGNMAKPSKDMRPHYPITASAGFLGNEASVKTDDVVMMPKIEHIKRDYDFTLTVEGDSMEPLYFNGDTLACKKIMNKYQLKPGRTYVVDSRNGAVVKKLLSMTNNSLRLHSENPKYPDFRIVTDDIFGIAEVVGSVDANPELREKAYREAMLEYVRKIYRQKLENPEIDERELINQIIRPAKP